MSKIMKALSMRELLTRVAGEWAAKGSAYDIPKAAVERILALEASSPGFEVNGYRVSLPIGPAAGPHTQIAPNLVAAWLAGSRVFELKTVQQNDALHIDKPCIDALDEGHNVEWSTELTLADARDEYLRGWIAIQILRAALGSSGGFMFNLSVGYTLEGIKGAKMDAFIEGMRAPASHPQSASVWAASLKEAQDVIRGAAFATAFGAEGQARALAIALAMPAAPIHSVTLSTMHGCPPDEIERIGAYLIEEKGFDTYVKLNPTLLGYDAARRILDASGWERVIITRPNFEHDLQFPQALALVVSLRAKAAARHRRFGIKLSNTLANVNDGRRMPGGERYMSGRALFPITTRLAAELSKAIPDCPPFSYCGGASAINAKACLEAGLGPLTLATDILKPGGYLRLEPMARAAVEALKAKLPARPDAAKLAALADAALKAPEYRGDYKKGETKIAKKLPLSDCFAAPCVEACPAAQKPPAYMKALAAGDAGCALSIVLADNPLPRVTGVLCDHQCMFACARVDYEGPVEIRAMKLACARAADIPAVKKPTVAGKGKTAVFGAGPAGLSAAHYLALEGYPVTVFDKAQSPGGVPADVIPAFRIAREDIAADVERIKALGAQFVCGWDGKIDLAALRTQGYTSFVVATGAPSPRELALKGAGIKLVDALEFLEEAHRAARENRANRYAGATAIAVAGGGNTAMDASRVAARLPGRPAVSILYRRSLAEMPADREEFEAALADGVAYYELSLPESAAPGTGSGAMPTLTVREMELGEPDASGRRAPVASERSRTIPCDLIVAAVGETPDLALLTGLGLVLGKDGKPVADPTTMASSMPGVYLAGDARRGPSSIIAAEADGRKAAYAILRAAGIEPSLMPLAPAAPDYDALSRRGEYLPSVKTTRAEPGTDLAFIKREAERCLSCGSACLRCVEVCPNRANLALPVAASAASPYKQAIQILHTDELCNECGNCGFFCPYEGEPYLGKPTFFGDEGGLRASGNAGFAFSGTAEKPALILREEPGKKNEIEVLDYGAWSGAAADPAGGARAALLSLARSVWRDHAYLIPKGRV